jgi:hypothetical protein
MVKEEINLKPITPLSSTKQSSSTKKKPPSHAKQKAKQTGKHITFRIPDALDTKIMRPDFVTTVPENKRYINALSRDIKHHFKIEYKAKTESTLQVVVVNLLH